MKMSLKEKFLEYISRIYYEFNKNKVQFTTDYIFKKREYLYTKLREISNYITPVEKDCLDRKIRIIISEKLYDKDIGLLQLISDEIIRQRLYQAIFNDFCKDFILRQEKSINYEIYNYIKDWITSDPQLYNSYGKINFDFFINNFGFILTDPLFYDSIFFNSKFTEPCNRFLFNHIPRTGGTTIATVLQKTLENEILFLWATYDFVSLIRLSSFSYGIDILLEIRNKKFKNFIYFGHFCLFRTIERMRDIKGDEIAITVLRDPFEISISAINFFIQKMLHDQFVINYFNVSEEEKKVILEHLKNTKKIDKNRLIYLIEKIISSNLYENFVGEMYLKYLLGDTNHIDSNNLYDVLEKKIKIIENKVRWIIFDKISTEVLNLIINKVNPNKTLPPNFTLPRINESRFDIRMLGNDYIENLRELIFPKIKKSYQIYEYLRKKAHTKG